jgi:hypothetical protein
MVQAINKRFLPGAPMYFVATILAFINVPLSLGIVIGLAILYLLPYRPISTE